ncbi:MAG: hypothetical protein ACP5GI_02045 [Sulfolobales archaeon]
MLASAQVIGLDTSNSYANLLGVFELSIAIPLVGYNIVSQIKLLDQALEKLSEYVIRRITPLRERLIELTEKSQALITLVSPLIGYDKAAELSKILLRGVSIRQALRELGFSEEDINRILDPRRLTSPGIPSKNI